MPLRAHFLPRSVGLGAGFAPPQKSARTEQTVDRYFSTSPISSASPSFVEQHPPDFFPHTPANCQSAQRRPPTKSCPIRQPSSWGKYSQGQTGTQHEQDAAQRLPVGYPAAAHPGAWHAPAATMVRCVSHNSFCQQRFSPSVFPP